MHKLAGVPVATEARLLVVLAHVRLVVEAHTGPDVHVGSQGAVHARALFRGDGVLPPEALGVVCVGVHALVGVAGLLFASLLY